MTKSDRSVARVAELVSVLVEHETLRCVPQVSSDDGHSVTLSVTFAGDGGSDDGLSLLALFHELQYVQDVAQMRGFAEQYGIDPEALEKMIPVLPSVESSRTVPSAGEFEAIIRVLEQCERAPDDPLLYATARDRALILSAIPKLKALQTQEIF